MQIENLGRDRVLLEATIERLIELLDAIEAPFTDLEPCDEDEAADDRPCDEADQDMEPDDEDSGIEDYPQDEPLQDIEPDQEFGPTALDAALRPVPTLAADRMRRLA